MRNLLHLFFSVSASVLIPIFRNPVSILIIGDIQTGAIILNIEQPAGDKAIFHGVLTPLSGARDSAILSSFVL